MVTVICRSWYSAASVPQPGTCIADQHTPRHIHHAAVALSLLMLSHGFHCGCVVQVVCRGQATVVFLDQQYKPIRVPVKVKETLLHLHQEYKAGLASS